MNAEIENKLSIASAIANSPDGDISVKQKVLLGMAAAAQPSEMGFFTESLCGMAAEVVYQNLALKGYTQSQERSEVHDRLIVKCAEVRGEKLYCSIHEGTKLNSDGSCKHCEETANIVGMDMAEARAMRLADIANENGMEDFEENLAASQERDPIQEAEHRVGADGTDEYFREVTGKNELSEPAESLYPEDDPEEEEC